MACGLGQQMTTDQTPDLEWRDGLTPISVRFNDPYFSMADGLAETQHVFLAGNGLPQRFRPGFHVAELGFGTGLNMLATLAAWEQCGVPGKLAFTSFEAFPMDVAQMQRALRAFPSLEDIGQRFFSAWDDQNTTAELTFASVRVMTGDARQLLPNWSGQANAWFLDGFSPAKNPELWEPELMAEVARHTAPNGTFATYSAAGHIRGALGKAGFSVDRVAGFGRKRHMTTGTLKASK